MARKDRRGGTNQAREVNPKPGQESAQDTRNGVEEREEWGERYYIPIEPTKLLGQCVSQQCSMQYKWRYQCRNAVHAVKVV